MEANNQNQIKQNQSKLFFSGLYYFYRRLFLSAIAPYCSYSTPNTGRSSTCARTMTLGGKDKEFSSPARINRIRLRCRAECNRRK